MRKPKTTLLSFLQKAFNYALVAETKGEVFADDLREKVETERLNRRQFIKQSLGATVGGGLMLSAFGQTRPASTSPKIAVVGAGIAGLYAAFLLKDRFNVTVYEASSSNSWGRIRTRTRNGLTAEIGGEFIDTGHADMRRLAMKFGLGLIDTDEESKGLIKDSYFFGGKHYKHIEVVREFGHFANRIARDAADYEAEKPRALKLDELSIEEYLERNLRMARGWLFNLLDAAYTSEFGMEIGKQSALNFITMIGTTPGRFEVFGESDEKYKIRGGNFQLIEALRRPLEGRIETRRRLEAIKQQNGYVLSFDNGKPVNADVVVLAIPFTTLRNVDLKRLDLPEQKKTAINELGYGTSAKLLLNVSSRVWREQNRAGYLFNEKVQNGWENSDGQPNGQNKNRGAGGYTVFLGGDAGKELTESKTKMYVNELNRAFPKFESVCENEEKGEVFNWSQDEFAKGGYACYKVGQWTSISGAEASPVNNLFFCGEHCSSDFQGYMNGGAETGRKAAEDIIRKFRAKAGKTRKARRR